MSINGQTTILELAARVSQALEASGLVATLSGGAAVSIHTENEYESSDLDFVCAARRGELAEALRPLGFILSNDRRHFVHPGTTLYLEFPSAPLQFGRRVVSHDQIPMVTTPFGTLRVVTPMLCVMDRLAAYWHWTDRQSWDQAVMLARHHDLDYRDLKAFAREERADPRDIDRLKTTSGRS